MSASLVGSEMCIRDSIEHCERFERVERFERLQRCKRFKRCKRVQRFPVSYTHLTLPTICSV
eukprot:4572519-Alexandrium_andersonii.AAC.1